MKKEISQMVRFDLKDPRIRYVTITDVEVTNDLKYAKVYVSVLGPEQDRIDTLAGLSSAAKYIRGEIGRRLHIRHSPEITFHYDGSIEYGAKIEKLLRQIEQERSSKTEDEK